jgi:large subunit ribosomal protein L19
MSGQLPQVDRVEKKHLRSSHLEDFRPGDTVRVHYEIVEGEKKRVQLFQGVVIRIRGRKTMGNKSSFTVRKVSYQVGVERTFLCNSPKLIKVEVVTRGRVRKSKLYYMRQLAGKSARIQERIETAGEESAPESSGQIPGRPEPEAKSEAKD